MSRILSLYILYTFIPLFVSRHLAYLDKFLGPKQCFHALIYLSILATIVYTMQAVKIAIPVYFLAKFDTS